MLLHQQLENNLKNVWRTKMSKKLITLFIALCFLMISATVFAQMKPEQAKPVGPELKGVIAPVVKTNIESARIKLKTIESLYSKIEGQKQLSIADSNELMKLMDAYAKLMEDTFKAAIKDAEEYAKSEGKAGSIESLKFFETEGKRLERITKDMETKAKRMELMAKDGTIKFDRASIDKMSPAELDDFQKFLTPKGLAVYQKLAPNKFPVPPDPGGPRGVKPGASLNLNETNQLAENVRYFCSSIPEQIINLFVAPAEAAVAAGCIGPCIARSWSSCLSCVAAAGSGAVRCVDEFRSCWGKIRWYNAWWRAPYCITQVTVCLL